MASESNRGEVGRALIRFLQLKGRAPEFRLDGAILPTIPVGNDILADRIAGYPWTDGSAHGPVAAQYSKGGFLNTNTEVESRRELVVRELWVATPSAPNTEVRIIVYGPNAAISASAGHALTASENYQNQPTYVPDARLVLFNDATDFSGLTSYQRVFTAVQYGYVQVPGYWILGPGMALLCQPAVVNTGVYFMARGTVFVP